MRVLMFKNYLQYLIIVFIYQNIKVIETYAIRVLSAKELKLYSKTFDISYQFLEE